MTVCVWSQQCCPRIFFLDSAYGCFLWHLRPSHLWRSTQPLLTNHHRPIAIVWHHSNRRSHPLSPFQHSKATKTNSPPFPPTLHSPTLLHQKPSFAPTDKRIARLSAQIIFTSTERRCYVSSLFSNSTNSNNFCHFSFCFCLCLCLCSLRSLPLLSTTDICQVSGSAGDGSAEWCVFQLFLFLFFVLYFFGLISGARICGGGSGCRLTRET